jgi:hypothetical protein
MGGGSRRPSYSNRSDVFNKNHADAGRLPMTVAPLIFPEGEPDPDNQLRGGKVGGKFKKAYASFNHYLDQRARAQFVSNW